MSSCSVPPTGGWSRPPPKLQAVVASTSARWKLQQLERSGSAETAVARAWNMPAVALGSTEVAVKTRVR